MYLTSRRWGRFPLLALAAALVATLGACSGTEISGVFGGGDAQTDEGSDPGGPADADADAGEDLPDDEGPDADAADPDPGELPDAADADVSDIDTTDSDAGEIEDPDVPTDETDGDDADTVEETDVGPPPCASDVDCAWLEVDACATARCDLATSTCYADPKNEGQLCDDGNACSEGDLCQGGKCVGQSAKQCVDGNVCTDDQCAPATGCVFKNNFASCDDGDPCSLGDACVAGACVGGSATCDDGNQCTEDSCDPDSGGCSFTVNDALECSDGDECTGGDFCEDGTCVSGAADGCDDGNQCTQASCVEAECVVDVLSGLPCSDGDPCTAGDVCVTDTCVSGDPETCDDGNACTDGVCDPVEGCQYTQVAEGGPCDDGDSCTEGGTCVSGVCVPDSGVDCDDGNPCTADTCDPEGGCEYALVAGACEDGDLCTLTGVCQGGTCITEALICDDGDACTADTCDPLIGCEAVDVSDQCDDGNPCTDDSCDPASGCLVVANELACDDGLLCTLGDVCSGGVCAGAPLDCDDGQACTADVCDPEEGCLNEPFVGPCEDGDLCTGGELCDAAGDCLGGTPLDPDDGIECTVDSCEPGIGVVNAPDDDVCAVGEVCSPTAGCEAGQVSLIITKVVLDAGTTDGQGQWLQLQNIGNIAVDVTNYLVVNQNAATAPIFAASGNPDDPVVIGPGELVSGIKATPSAPADLPDGYGFYWGSADDGFLFDKAGESLGLITTSFEPADAVNFKPINAGPQLSFGDFPIAVGLPTHFDQVAAQASDSPTVNDNGSGWCIPTLEAGPEAFSVDCARARINEVSVAGDKGVRWIELHLPAGGPLGGLVVRLQDAAGNLITQINVPGQRAPLGKTVLLLDGTGGVILPGTNTDGAVQLFRNTEDGLVLQDVYGYGTLEVSVDADDGFPMFEGAPGPAQQEGSAALRPVDGIDTDNNLTDFLTVMGGSPGELNTPWP